MIRRGFAVLCLAVTSLGAHAHDARPLFVDVVEEAPLTYRASVRVPPSVETQNVPEILWPADCRVPSAPVVPQAVRVMRLRCDRELAGRPLRIVYPAYNPSLATVLRFTPRDGGEPRVAVLPPEQSTGAMPERRSSAAVLAEYLRLGVEHIWRGIDHLLFVLGLLVLAGTLRRVLVVITGFTLAHSVTLSLAALGVLRVPVVPTEAVIALSILFLARELALGRADSLAFRRPLLVSTSFGLLHGLGFAAALAETGLPRGAVVPALAAFNLGVEAGQVAVILPCLGLAVLIRRGIGAQGPIGASGLRTALAYAIGIPASYWLLARCATL